MYQFLLALLMLCCLPPCVATAQDAASLVPRVGLNRLAMGIADGPAPLRADLARIALSELAAVYAAEAEVARQDMLSRAKQRELSTWANAVAKLATDYATLAESVTLTTPVHLSIGPESNLHLVVAGRLVVVSSPRMREQAEFEQRVITRFCELNRCEGLLDEPATAVATTIDGKTSATQWSFSQQAGPVCGTSDGLEFQFMNMDNLARKRRVCARVVTELNTLAAAIAQKTADGVRVDWNRLAIHSLPDGEEHHVMLNGVGDYLQLPLPALAVREGMFIVVRPWLAAKVNGEHYSLVVLHAGRRLAAPGQTLE
jgi:hypothetical protein